MVAALLRDDEAPPRADAPRAEELRAEPPRALAAPPRALTAPPRLALFVAAPPRAPEAPRALLAEREADFGAALFFEAVDLAGALFFAAAVFLVFLAAVPLDAAERLLALLVDFFAADLEAAPLRPFDVAIGKLGILGMK